MWTSPTSYVEPRLKKLKRKVTGSRVTTDNAKAVSRATPKETRDTGNWLVSGANEKSGPLTVTLGKELTPWNCFQFTPRQ